MRGKRWTVGVEEMEDPHWVGCFSFFFYIQFGYGGCDFHPSHRSSSSLSSALSSSAAGYVDVCLLYSFSLFYLIFLSFSGAHMPHQ